MASTKNEIVILATARAKSGKEADLERALRDAAEPTRTQHGCLRFELYRSAQDPAVITAFEHSASEEDHDRHLQGDHVKRLVARFSEILAAPPAFVNLKPL